MAFVLFSLFTYLTSFASVSRGPVSPRFFVNMTSREKFRSIPGAPLPIGIKSAAVPISAAKSAPSPLNWIRPSGGFRESRDGNDFQSSHPAIEIASNHLKFSHITFLNRHTLTCVRFEDHSLSAPPLNGCHPDRRAERSSRPGVEGPLFGRAHATDRIQRGELKRKGEEKALARRSLLAKATNRYTQKLKFG
jgi:hypothetical protein